MKIFSVSQIRAADAYTISNELIASVDLMERAARACYVWFHNNISRQLKIAIFCGQGNNGGDGLALARMLHSTGYKVSVFILKHSSSTSQDFAINLNRLEALNLKIKFLESADHLPLLNEDVVVDALLGSGLNKALEGFLAKVVAFLNKQNAHKIAIDIPTGMFADDNLKNNLNKVFKADVTLTFQFPKLSFMFSEYGSNVGKFEVLDIGLSSAFIQKTETQNLLIDSNFIKTALPQRNKFDHKGTYGHALIIAGSYGKIGAAILASRAALKTGAGLVTCYVPACGVSILQTANPEVMVLADVGEQAIENINYQITPTAIGIGPGLGNASNTQSALLKFLSKQETPVVIDADALNILAERKEWHLVPENSILTPHLGELDRIFGKKLRGESIYEAAKAFAMKHQVILLVKGPHTGVFAPNGCVFFNATGTNGMATAGSGDVLTGIISGFIAQGVKPLEAAILGVYFHGKAGEAAASKFGDAAMISGDIISHINIPD